jgi:hypothetical protein
VIDGLPTVNSTTVTETVQVGLHPFVDGEVLQVAPETITIAPSCNPPIDPRELTTVDVYVTGVTPIVTVDGQGQLVTTTSPMVYYVNVVYQNYQPSSTTSASSTSDSGGGLDACLIVMIVCFCVFFGLPFLLGVVSGIRSCCCD